MLLNKPTLSYTGVLSLLGSIGAILTILLRNEIPGWGEFLMLNMAIVNMLLFTWRYKFFTSAAFEDLWNFGEIGILNYQK